MEKQDIKGIQIEKRDKTLFMDDMIVYLENPKESTKELLEPINEYNKCSGYKVNIQKSVLSLMPEINRCNLKLKANAQCHLN